MLKWLGVEIPVGTEKRVLSRKCVATRCSESIKICADIAKRILEAASTFDCTVPLGFSVESVSKDKVEGKAVFFLFEHLRELLERYYNRETDVANRMLNENATYLVKTQDRGMTVFNLKDSGPELFVQIPPLKDLNKNLLENATHLRAVVAGVSSSSTPSSSATTPLSRTSSEKTNSELVVGQRSSSQS